MSTVTGKNPRARVLWQPRSLQLQAGQVQALRLLQVCTLSARQARVWVTQEGRAEDFWLEPGQSVVLLPGSLVVVESDAQAPCTVRVEPVVLRGARSWLDACLGRLHGMTALALRRSPSQASAWQGGEGR